MSKPTRLLVAIGDSSVRLVGPFPSRHARDMAFARHLIARRGNRAFMLNISPRGKETAYIVSEDHALELIRRFRAMKRMTSKKDAARLAALAVELGLSPIDCQYALDLDRGPIRQHVLDVVEEAAIHDTADWIEFQIRAMSEFNANREANRGGDA